MFALVCFLKEFDQKAYRVPVQCIKDFQPVIENDFDKNGVYTTLWEDNENSENTGLYPSKGCFWPVSNWRLYTYKFYVKIGERDNIPKMHVDARLRGEGFCVVAVILIRQPLMGTINYVSHMYTAHHD